MGCYCSEKRPVNSIDGHACSAADCSIAARASMVATGAARAGWRVDGMKRPLFDPNGQEPGAN